MTIDRTEAGIEDKAGLGKRTEDEIEDETEDETGEEAENEAEN